MTLDIPETEADLLVIGAGAAGMTAALVAALEGLRVVLCEATQQVGGTTATSAGTLWIPGNPQGVAAGHGDTVDAARTYLDALIGEPDHDGRREAFLGSGPAMLRYLEARTAVRFASAGMHPDYLPHLPGAAVRGRAVSPLPFDGRLLGADFGRVRPPLAEFMVLGGMMLGKADIAALVGRYRSWRAFIHSARLVLRHARERIRHPRGARWVMGNALVGRLLHSLRTAGVQLHFGTRLRGLEMEGGRVVGARVDAHGQTRVMRARRGVVLATGGVGHDAALRHLLAPQGPTMLALAAEAVRGDGLGAGRAAGAALTGLERPFLWQPVSVVHRKDGSTGLFPHLFLDRAKPGLIAVDGRGRRFVDEAASYHHFVEGMVRADAVPAQLVCSTAFIRRHGLGAIAPGTRDLRPWVARRMLVVAPTLDALAQTLGLPAATLADTVQRHDHWARLGEDPDFHKGASVFDRFNGDPAHAPNPCVGPVGPGPYAAMAVWPGDAASSAGLATDAQGCVLDAHGRPIGGLYACGNDAASPMQGHYPGPGTTLGPGMAQAYRIARHASAAGRGGS
ncbi:FAD-dependent oxidoreductase [Pseudacidovorax sp. NFM-22]|uniref:FAD-dependent oxidoreductase n=1 Tax=Pseudacidovorax sp. NFM-22 TaxID=2744469 RepID=UPI001F3168BC|nr:FAD-dependent oxidoreductase [Pseudacidovorax sp. NFM-22]